jgi:hypothetical protein
MALELVKEADGQVVHVRLSGKLTKEDYERFVPGVERLIHQYGKIRVLMEMHDFHGWELGALWEDTKFDLKHFRDIERIAMVGDAKWEAGMAKFCAPFTTAKIRYFTEDQLAEARQWIASDTA